MGIQAEQSTEAQTLGGGMQEHLTRNRRGLHHLPCLQEGSISLHVDTTVVGAMVGDASLKQKAMRHLPEYLVEK